MTALAHGARLGLMAGATVVTFGAVIIAAVGVLVAVVTIVDAIMPEGKSDANDKQTGE